MERIKTSISRKDFRDKVRACWIGKNIGGTLGGPWECYKHTHTFTFYEPVPDKSAPNDDLDLQLVWLKMLEEKGVDPSLKDFADYWNKYAAAYPWNEYGFFMRNYERGLLPPVAGCFENYYVDEMGSPIRSEIWACLYPGDPDAAARMAWKDSAVDHAGGEGTYGEMFWAAAEAAAFVIDDPMTLIKIGLNVIPLSCHIARVIRDAVWCYENKLTWGEARARILQYFGHHNPCNAIPNHGFTIIGLLYGEDFGDQLCKAVNCGYDTDCTGATLGSLLGIMHGTAGIPQKWIDPIGEDIVLHKFTGDCDAPKNVEELTDRTIVLAEKCIERNSNFVFGDETELPNDLLSRLHENQLAQEALRQDIHCGVELLNDSEITLHYNGEPVIYPGIAKTLSISGEDIDYDKLTLELPNGWLQTSSAPGQFQINTTDNIQNRNKINVIICEEKVTFTILGPGELKPAAAGQNVTICPKCHAREEACIC